MDLTLEILPGFTIGIVLHNLQYPRDHVERKVDQLKFFALDGVSRMYVQLTRINPDCKVLTGLVHERM